MFPPIEPAPFLRPRRCRVLGALLLLAAAASAPGCVRERTDVCGRIPAGGGPALVTTRDEELCEIVRLRVHDALAEDAKLDELRAQLLHDASYAWEDARTIDAMLARVRTDAGEGFASRIARAVADVREHGSRPHDTACEDAERCLVRGAARGARFAIGDALDWFARNRPPMFRPLGAKDEAK